MKARETAVQAQVRWERLRLLQTHYALFQSFLTDAMEELGFDTSEVQVDIGNFMAYGPQYLMVQAQRSQAKTTIAAIFAVWSLIHSPAHRVLIISAGGTQAVEISTLIVRLIMSMDVLECMRPDATAGDRTSVEAFDVHHSLKGLDKSPSVACIGVDSNLQGKRADLLIPDDIESVKNSATATQRAKLLHLTKDFTSICQKGRILWLGTPQTRESIYNSLPGRGVTVRVWPGRYPTTIQLEHYGRFLAPLLVTRLASYPHLGIGGGVLLDQGKPLDPLLLDEEALQKKELDQGKAYFQLQHMLNTSLSDDLRFPLTPDKLVVIRNSGGRFPMTVTRGMTSDRLRDFTVADHSFKMMMPHEVSPEVSNLQSLVAYIDPAAGGKVSQDETAWAIGGFLNGNVYLLSAGGMVGGYDEDKLRHLAKVLARFNTNGWKLDVIKIEKNMGYGAFRAVMLPILREAGLNCQVEDDLVTGQKELRIINTLAPVMGRGALIVDEAVVEEDAATCARHDASSRQNYSLFSQLAKMTQQRQALVHDDRIDALEGLVRHFSESIAQDQKKNLEGQREREYQKSIADPLGHNRYTKGQHSNNMMRHRRR